MIPKVVQVVESKRPADAAPWTPPTACPVCGSRGDQARGRGGPPLPERLLPGPGRGAAQALRRPRGHGHRGPGRRARAPARSSRAWCGTSPISTGSRSRSWSSFERMAEKSARQPAGADRGQQGPRAAPPAVRPRHPLRGRARGAAAGPPLPQPGRAARAPRSRRSTRSTRSGRPSRSRSTTGSRRRPTAPWSRRLAAAGVRTDEPRRGAGRRSALRGQAVRAHRQPGDDDARRGQGRHRGPRRPRDLVGLEEDRLRGGGRGPGLASSTRRRSWGSRPLDEEGFRTLLAESTARLAALY